MCICTISHLVARSVRFSASHAISEMKSSLSVTVSTLAACLVSQNLYDEMETRIINSIIMNTPKHLHVIKVESFDPIPPRVRYGDM